MRLGALFVTALATLGILASTAFAAPQPVTGRAIVFDRGFDVVYWDSVNGERKIGRGLEPSLSSDGRYIAYVDRDGPAALCNAIVLHDLRERRDLPLPGINTDDCKNNPRVSRDGRFIVFSGNGTSAGDPTGIYLYDVVNQRRIDLPEPVNSPSTEGWPSLTDDGRLLAFVSGRNNFDRIFLADISAVPSGGAATLLPLPGLPMGPDDSQRAAEISGDGSTIVYGYGFLTAGSVGIYDRTSSSNATPAVLAQSGDTFQPGINSAGNLVVVARTPANSSTSEPHLFDRGSGALTRLSILDSSVSEDELDIADPVTLADTTRPRIKIRCKSRARKPRRIICTVRSSEAATGKLVVRRGKRAVGKGKKLRFKAAGRRRVVIRSRVVLTKRTKLVARAKLKDSAGLGATRKARFRVR